MTDLKTEEVAGRQPASTLNHASSNINLKILTAKVKREAAMMDQQETVLDTDAKEGTSLVFEPR